MLKLIALQRLHVGPVDLTVGRGECISVVGASGAGKSVLLRAIADLDPHEGDASLDDTLASAIPAPQWRAQVAYVPASSGWWSPRVADHFPPDMDFSAFERVGIAADACAWPVSRLSTGERQRLALLRAMGPRVRALLLDEPTSGLDPDNVERVERLLQSALGRGLSIVLVTHDAAQAGRLAARHFRLDAGRLLQEPA